MPGCNDGSNERRVKLDLEAVKSARLYQRIADQLAHLISTGQLKVGEKLPPEIDLARRLNVSRPTVREALIALETSGLIEVRNGSGAYVRPHASRASAFPWNDNPGSVPGPFEQFQARELIEPGVAMLAAAHITEAELLALEALIDLMEVNYPKGLGDEEGFRFHVQLAEASRNAYLAAAVRELWTLRGGEMWATLRGRLLKTESRQSAIVQRRRIVAALRARDGAMASAAMAKMLANARSIYFDGLDTAGRPQDETESAA
jgi:GntR family transcriptional repressor for pyruvate dehydrogenase complex